MKSKLAMFLAVALAAAALGVTAGRLIRLVPSRRRQHTRPWLPN